MISAGTLMQTNLSKRQSLDKKSGLTKGIGRPCVVPAESGLSFLSSSRFGVTARGDFGSGNSESSSKGVTGCGANNRVDTAMGS